MQSATKLAQYLTFMQCDVIGLVAFDLVLRIVRTGVMYIAFIVYILGVHPHYPAGDPARLGIPAHMIADLEHSRHDSRASTLGELREPTSKERRPLGDRSLACSSEFPRANSTRRRIGDEKHSFS